MAGSKKALPQDVPWRAAGSNSIPRIHHSPLLKLPLNPTSRYGIAVMRQGDPIGEGFATEAHLESAGPDCVIPGQVAPVRLLGLKVWPINVNLKFLEPVDRELKSMGKLMDSAFNLMNASFQDR